MINNKKLFLINNKKFISKMNLIKFELELWLIFSQTISLFKFRLILLILLKFNFLTFL